MVMPAGKLRSRRMKNLHHIEKKRKHIEHQNCLLSYFSVSSDSIVFSKNKNPQNFSEKMSLRESFYDRAVATCKTMKNIALQPGPDNYANEDALRNFEHCADVGINSMKTEIEKIQKDPLPVSNINWDLQSKTLQELEKLRRVLETMQRQIIVLTAHLRAEGFSKPYEDYVPDLLKEQDNQ
jgi:hypothetical protein